MVVIGLVPAPGLAEDKMAIQLDFGGNPITVNTPSVGGYKSKVAPNSAWGGELGGGPTNTFLNPFQYPTGKHASYQQFDYMSPFQQMMSKFNAKNFGGGIKPNTYNFTTGNINLPAEYKEDPYQFKNVDPETAINAARAPINTEMQRGFAEAGARYGQAGALNSQPYAEFGLGKASGRAAENIAAMTEQMVYDASKFNRDLEAQMANARKQREFGGWQARGGWDVGSQQDTEARRLQAQIEGAGLGEQSWETAQKLNQDWNLDYSNDYNQNLMSVLGMQGGENRFGYNAQEEGYDKDYNRQFQMSQADNQRQQDLLNMMMGQVGGGMEGMATLMPGQGSVADWLRNMFGFSGQGVPGQNNPVPGYQQTTNKPGYPFQYGGG